MRTNNNNFIVTFFKQRKLFNDREMEITQANLAELREKLNRRFLLTIKIAQHVLQTFNIYIYLNIKYI